MSKHIAERIPCPHCGFEGVFKIWTSINTVMNPEMKKRVRNNEAFVYTCPRCRARTTFDYSLLYHQMDDFMMIYYAKKDEEVEMAQTMFRSNDVAQIIGQNSNKYLYRIVRSQNELREKLFLFDVRMDDRVVELLKVYYLALMQEKKPELDITEVRFELGRNGSITFTFLSGEKSVANSVVTQELYDSIEEEYISKRPELREDDIIIDSEWASRVLTS